MNCKKECTAEFLGTYVLVLFGTASVVISEAFMDGTLFLLILLLGHLTGTSFNPARSIGPALSSGHWSNMVVYLIGPFLSAVFAAIPFRSVNDDESES